MSDNEKEQALRMTSFTVEHVVVSSRLPYEQVATALEARLGLSGDWQNASATTGRQKPLLGRGCGADLAR